MSGWKPSLRAETIGWGAGTDGYVWTSDGAGGAAWEEASGGGGGIYAETIGDGSNTSYQVTHSLGSEDLMVQLWDISGADPVLATGDADSITVDDVDNITIVFSAAPDTDDYRVVVVGGVSSGGAGGSSWSPILDVKPGTPDTPDDDFDASTLDGKWTVVQGSSGTVSLLQTSATAIYDLTTRPGYLLMQVKSNPFSIRQDYTLPDGASMILAVAGFGNGGHTNIKIGLALNNNDTSPNSGTAVQMAYESDAANDVDVQWTTGNFAAGNTWNGDSPVPRLYFRITRVGTMYSGWLSSDGGESWAWLDEDDQSTTLDNVWIYSADAPAMTYATIVSFDWIRQGTNALDPW